MGRCTFRHDKKFQMRTHWKIVRVSVQLKSLVTLYRYQTETSQLCSIERNGTSLFWSRRSGTHVSMPAMKTGTSLQGAAAWKWNPEGNSKCDGKESSKDQRTGDCTQWTSRGQCSRGDSCSFKHDLNKKSKRDKNKIPFYFRRDKTLETRGKRPKGTSPSGKSHKLV